MPAPSSPTSFDPDRAYTYAELRSLCKSAGVSAAGKAVDLRERLSNKLGGDPRRLRAAAHEPTGDRGGAGGMAEQAMSTPLPPRTARLPRIKTRVTVDEAAATTTATSRRSVFSLSGLLKVLPLAAMTLYVLETHVCKMPAVSDVGPPLEPVVSATCSASAVAVRQASSVLRLAIEMSPAPINLSSLGKINMLNMIDMVGMIDIKNLIIKGVDDAHASLLDKVDGRTKVPFEPLNKAVLETFTAYNAGMNSVVSHLEDVWSGRHVSSEDKANAVVFACLGSDDCAEAEADISAVASPASVLKVLVDESTTRGDVQKQIAGFLKERPNGVVVVPRVERWSPVLLSVLNNCLGESGSLIQDGITVPTSLATWLLTARVPVSKEMTQSSVKLSLGVKGALLEGWDATDEMVSAVLTAFRRRLDVVALGSLVS